MSCRQRSARRWQRCRLTRRRARPRWRRLSWAWMTSGAVRIAAPAGRCRGARRAVFAGSGARSAARASVRSPAQRCPGCTTRSAGLPSAPRLPRARRSRSPPRAAGLRRAGASLAPPLPGGGAQHPSREHQRLGWRAGPGRGGHPDGQQPPQPDQGLPARTPRRRHQVPGQLSEVVPSHRTRRPAVAQSLPRSRDGQTMPTSCELRL